MDSTRLGQLFDNIRAEVAELEKRLGAKDAVIRSVAEDSCALLGQLSGAWLRSTVRALISL